MDADRIAVYTDELLALADDLSRPSAVQFVRRVFEDGSREGSRAAIANVAVDENEKDAQIRRLAERLRELGEDAVAIAHVMGGRA